MKKIVIGREAYDKIQYYVNKAKFEISGFGDVQIIDGVATVTDVFLLKQENTPSETDIDPDSLAKLLYEHTKSGSKGELKFWWHSHVNMDVFWSGTDMDTIEQLTKNGWFVHGVFNKKGEQRIAYSNNDPFEVFIDDLDLEIDEELFVSDDLTALQLNIFDLEDTIEKSQKAIKDTLAAMHDLTVLQCEGLYDTLVTDKTYTYKGNYKGGNKGKSNTIHKNGEIIQMTDYFQPDSTTPSTGPSLDYDWTKFFDYWGARELYEYGYDFEEIEYMQDYCQVYDLTDLEDYNQLFGTDGTLDAMQETLESAFEYGASK